MTGGIVNLPSGVLQKASNNHQLSNSTGGAKSASRRANQPRLKLLIRRLPPGLTEAELHNHLGPEWKLGGGKVDWLVYKKGKVSKDLAKPSRESRVYLHVTEEAHISALSNKVRQTQFSDAKNTSKDPALLGPPLVEYAPYSRIPPSRKRRDARQGAIDQDPEFKEFLESLTNPIQKPAADLESTSQKDIKVTTTPLIEAIREKKALREKAGSKASRRDAKDPSKKKLKQPAVVTPVDKSKKPTKPVRSGKDDIRIAGKGVVTSGSATQTPEKAAPVAGQGSTASAERRRERPGAFNLAAKIQNDLGLGPSKRGARSQRAESTQSSQAAPVIKSAEPSTVGTSHSSPAPSTASSPRREPRNRDRRVSKPQPKPEEFLKPRDPPTILKKPSTQHLTKPPPTSEALPKPTIPSATHKSPPQAASTPPLRHRAFLKHANPSQGITEDLLKSALSAHGSISHVEIDKRKGIAYADFSDAAGLASAIATGKIEVAQGAVQVLEYKERGPRAGGGPGGGRNGPASVGGGAGGARPGTAGGDVRGRGSMRGRGGRGRGGVAAGAGVASLAGGPSAGAA